ncbi:hypothetical protein JHK85_006938 [Glycine max]|nr:hypothetical protein JHK85_006938 [Glycine max]
MFPSSSYSFLLCFFSLANSNEAVPRPPSSRPYGGLTPQGPAPSGIRGHASFLKTHYDVRLQECSHNPSWRYSICTMLSFAHSNATFLLAIISMSSPNFVPQPHTPLFLLHPDAATCLPILWFVREVMLHVLKAYSCQFEIEPQVAERQGKYLAILLNKIGKANGGRANSAKDVDFGDQFVYKHMGSMASIGSYKALVDLR